MTTKVGYLDPILERHLTVIDVAAIATIKAHFWIEDSENANRYCLQLWYIIHRWYEKEIFFPSLKDFLLAIKEEVGFSETSICNLGVFNPTVPVDDYIEYLDDQYANVYAVLGSHE